MAKDKSEKFFQDKNKFEKEFEKLFKLDRDFKGFLKRDDIILYKDNPRYALLNSELEDFKILQKELKQAYTILEEIILTYRNRYQLESRNSFDSLMHDRYREFLVSTRKLTELLKTQPFYEKRMKELQDELQTLIYENDKDE